MGDKMSALLVGVAVVIGFIVLLPHLASKQTKLFRRVWSSERAGANNPHYNAEQGKAIDALVDRYGIDGTADGNVLRRSIAPLMADALKFDMTYQRNLGVEVVSVLARELRARFPKIAE